ncbi:hypothetical protein O2N63_09185 [Aliiroseovarius sp. KMU-50]|uniref:Factor H binding protein C-terminal domain-containing protein n=1 Tax=Aliiroseovarius salicola TaxID=3009082 RepID=A0ABT4W172_9RHOB|nr:hypothetical protein [Aliiroseovarius sp. KMU-50]MDA5094261.1 hypothetical protein [Aliiroseovarius sp. KMU-50]
MKNILKAGILIAAVSACDNGGNNPITNPGPGDDDLLPGTTNPSSSRSITRYEEEDGSGNGYAQSISYNAADDTFSVDNLAFDGDNTYSRDNQVASLNGFRVYENDSIFQDSVTGAPINQFSHKALYGVSDNTDADGKPITRFAIVRTGAYSGFGFGGFLYERNGGVTIPTSGQAQFTGDYAGIRDFNGSGGLEYATGDMIMRIDFDDFNQGSGVDGEVTNRRIFSTNGTELTSAYLAELGISALPTILFKVGPGVMNNAGEIAGQLGSTYFDAAENKIVQYESGNYYAVLAGEGADMEVAGIIVVTSEDPFVDGVIARETGGFILYR